MGGLEQSAGLPAQELTESAQLFRCVSIPYVLDVHPQSLG